MHELQTTISYKHKFPVLLCTYLPHFFNIFFDIRVYQMVSVLCHCTSLPHKMSKLQTFCHHFIIQQLQNEASCQLLWYRVVCIFVRHAALTHSTVHLSVNNNICHYALQYTCTTLQQACKVTNSCALT